MKNERPVYFRIMVLVTGAGGLLGSHVVCELVFNGYDVRALYRREAAKQRVMQLMHHYYPETATTLFSRIEWVEGDILDLVDLEDGMTGCEKIVHCAALVSFHRRDFSRLFEHNRQGTANVVNTALHLGIKQLVHVSSTAAVGSDSRYDDGLKRETNGWNAGEKVSGYSLSKYSAEKEVWRGIEEGLNAVIINPSIMLGPGNWEESSLKIMRTLNDGLSFYTSGGNAFVNVKDVALLIRRLMESTVSGERFLATGHNLYFRELFEQVAVQLEVKPPKYRAGKFMTSLAWRLAGAWARFSGKRPSITKESARSSQRINWYCSDKIKAQFPDFEFTPLVETIQRTIEGRIQP